VWCRNVNGLYFNLEELMMRKMLMLIMCVCLTAGVAQATILTDGGFELAPFSGGMSPAWTTGADVDPAFKCEAWAGSSGTYGVAFEWWVGTSGIVEQNVAVTAGQEYNYSMMASKDAGDLTGAYTMDIEWFDAASASLGVDSLDVTLLLTVDMAAYGFDAIAPVGAVSADVGLGVAGGNIVMKADELTLVPEPATLCLLGIGGALIRRRKA
jgi:hypothetical protein